MVDINSFPSCFVIGHFLLKQLRCLENCLQDKQKKCVNKHLKGLSNYLIDNYLLIDILHKPCTLVLD